MHEYLTLTEAAKLIPGRQPGKRMAVGTIWRWCKRGVRDGIRLKSVLIGQQRYTTREWLQEFIDALTQAAEPDGNEPLRLRTPRQRRTAAEQATEELKKMWGQKQ
jgi:Protein of unknown function (DUF1580)